MEGVLNLRVNFKRRMAILVSQYDQRQTNTGNLSQGRPVIHSVPHRSLLRLLAPNPAGLQTCTADKLNIHSLHTQDPIFLKLVSMKKI